MNYLEDDKTNIFVNKYFGEKKFGTKVGKETFLVICEIDIKKIRLLFWESKSIFKKESLREASILY